LLTGRVSATCPRRPAARVKLDYRALTAWRCGPMASSPRDAAYHYAQSERLLDSVPEEPGTALLAAIVHALLAQAPRKARRRPAKHSNGGNGLPANLAWGDE